MDEEDIGELISVEEGTEKISALVPKILLDRMLVNYKKKVGAVREHGLRSSALFYFAARGVLDWEKEHLEGDVISRRNPKPASVEKPVRRERMPQPRGQ